MLLGRILGESGVPTALSQIERWSTQWSWVERCDDWDREQDRVAREEHQAAIAEARRVEAMAGTLLLGAAIRRLSGATDIREGEEVVVQPLDLNKTSASDVVRLADAGAKLLGKGLAIASTDFQNVTTVSGAAVYDLAHDFLALAVNALEDGMRAAVSANSDLRSFVAEHQNRLIADAGRVYPTRVRGTAHPGPR